MLQIPEDKLKDLLLKDGIVAEKAFDEAAQDADRMGQGVADILISKNIITADYYSNLICLVKSEGSNCTFF